MASRPPQSGVRVDDDGVRTFPPMRSRRLGWIAAVAIGVPIAATIVAIAIIRMAPAGRAAVPVPRAPDEAMSAPAGGAGAAPAPALQGVAAAPHEHVVPRRVERPLAVPTAAPEDDDEPYVDARDAIPALIAAGEQGGITVFPLPGTKPVKRGLIVPDDFPLPEGYVRHYQATDDGVLLPGILMFHPDYDFVNDHGQRIEVPSDRVVPPELAPPGLEHAPMLEPPTARRETRLP